MFRPTHLPSAPRRARGFAALLVSLAASIAAADTAEIQWHPDLPAAQEAGRSSHKPVLVIFTAGWSPEAVRFAQQTLASPEASSLVSACFEPLLVDVDADPITTRRMEVAHVPAACIVGDDGSRLASFECPAAPAEFVAIAAKAAQEAAATAAGTAPAAGTAAPARLSSSTELASSAFAAPPAVAAPPEAAGRGSISLVTAKVRQLSDFAAGAGTSTQAASATTSAEPPASRYVSATPADDPVLPRTAPAWPAEPTSAAAPTLTDVTPQPPARTAIEPATTLAATPWLSTQPSAAPAGSPAESESSATISDDSKKPATASTWSSFMAALQKPFTGSSPAAPKPASPPTLPPARPTSPLAATTPVNQPQSAVDDAYGSMPLGLEGYCPVTLAERGIWVEGRAQWGARHRGRTYLFAGPEQQQAFLATPDRFAPALSGDDPVLVVEQGKSLPGRRAYGVTYQSRMYLFASGETRATFSANPERYTANVMLAERPAPVDATRRY